MDGGGGWEMRERVSAEEWAARIELAALYRMVAMQGWDDLIFTHISMRVPGPEHHFLINPYGVLFEEMTASALVKVDLNGAVIAAQPGHFINPAGFTIHSAIHAAREDAHCVIHLHTIAGAGVSAQAEGLLPLTQQALIVAPQLAYHDYEGIALNLNERERLVADLGAKSMMILRNHGTMALGESPAAAWFRIYFLEQACAMQVAALSGGRAQALLAPDAAQAEVRAQTGAEIGAIVKLAWDASLRRLDRRLPGYDA